MYHIKDDGDYCTCGAFVKEVKVDDGTTFGRWILVDQSGSEHCD